MKIIRLTLLCFFVSFFSDLSGQINLDSLWSVWNDKTQADTNRLNAIQVLSFQGYLRSDPDSAFALANLQYELSRSINNKQLMCSALNTQGASFFYKGQLRNALGYFERCLELRIELGDKNKIGSVYNNIGVIYQSMGNYEKSLENLNKSLIMREQINELYGIANCHSNIGEIYTDQGNFDKAMVSLRKSLKIFKQLSLNSKKNNVKVDAGLAECYTRIGLLYQTQELYNNAIINYNKTISLSKKNNDKHQLATVWFYIAQLYESQKLHSKSYDYYKKSYDKFNEKGDLLNAARSLSSIGYVCFLESDYRNAIEKSLNAKKLFSKVNSIRGLDKTALTLYDCYREIGNTKKALENFELYILIKDSLANMDGIEKEKQREFHEQYVLEKQADSIKHADEIILHQAEAKSQKQRTNGFALIAVIVVLSLVLLFRQFKKVNSQKSTIESQHKKLNETYNEITDSINYAKRIQDALMTSSGYMKDVIPKSFVFFKPKDVVSGDFYWVYKSPKGHIFFTVVDCTGHGVPGAFMSMIGNSFLNEIIIENKIEDTAEILNNMREQIIKALKQEGVSSDSKDGMDMAICKYDPKKKTVQYSGAYNPLLHISKSEVNYIKGDSQPVAYFIGEQTPFTYNEVKVKKGDMLYIYSDGYQDQFGGSKGKKYMAVKFRKFLLSLAELPSDEQKQKIGEEFQSWKGNQDQIDDICVMGVRVT